MGIFTPDIHNLRELYITVLQRALSSEKQIVEDGLPGMIKVATNAELADALQKHLEDSRVHVTRLERILDEVEGEENDTRCKVTSALIGEGCSSARDATDPHVRDVALIAAGIQIEHHEMAVYASLKTWAEVLGEYDHAEILGRTMEEEKQADDLLTQLSTHMNVEAAVAA